MKTTTHYSPQGYKLARIKKGVKPWGGKLVTILEETIYPNGRIEFVVVKGNALINDGTTNGRGINFWGADKQKTFSPNELEMIKE